MEQVNLKHKWGMGGGMRGLLCLVPHLKLVPGAVHVVPHPVVVSTRLLQQAWLP
jgi:hypothetical protein